MSANRKTTIGVVFGGRSVEHDVSVVTGNQVMRAFDNSRYDVVPIYIGRDGKWYSGDPLFELENYKDDEIVSYKGVENVVLSPSTQHHGLIIEPVSGRMHRSVVRRLDVVFPAVHGSHGEDGTLQGLIEMADIPYVGCGVMGSALANDKAFTKAILTQHGIPVVDGSVVNRSDWLSDQDTVLNRVTDSHPFPLFVKPATLGSSIGVGRAEDETSLAIALDVALNFDRRALVEVAVTDAIEINCAVMGYGDSFQASVLEQPVSWDDYLTYEEKYMRGGGGMKSQERIIPAPISETMTERIQTMTIDAFKAVDGRGIARIDFMLESQQGVLTENSPVYLNEINTMPGSLAFYLWHETGMSQSDVVEHLVKLGRDAYADKRRNTYNYQTSLIQLTAEKGLSGAKGSKSV